MKPEFICIGAQKAGTTWLYARLREHSEFSLPPIKEMHYFDRSRSYPSPSYLAESELLRRLIKNGHIKHGIKRIFHSLKSRDLGLANWWMQFHVGNVSDTWYLNLYKLQAGITGDITPSYSILNREDVARMHRLNPQIRPIFLMRNPIERAWSHYRFGEKFGRPVVLNDLDKFKTFVESPQQDLRSNYL